MTWLLLLVPAAARAQEPPPPWTPGAAPVSGEPERYALPVPEAKPTPAVFEAAIDARALVGPDGAGVLVDATVRATLGLDGDFAWLLGAGLEPGGLAWGRDGGLLGGTARAFVGVDLGVFAFHMGGGVSTLSRRGLGDLGAETGVVVLGVRVGPVTGFHIDGGLRLAMRDPADAGGDVRVTYPHREWEFFLTGHTGFDGVHTLEAGATLWPGGPRRRDFGISLRVGGGGVQYQPRCRYGLVCDASWVAGGVAGVGLTLRL